MQRRTPRCAAAAVPESPAPPCPSRLRGRARVAQRDQWASMLPAFYGTAELSSSDVDRLWSAVHFVLTNRAARSTTWGVPEVTAACQAQLAALPAYRSAVAVAITRMAATYDRQAAARTINKTYITFFTPF